MTRKITFIFALILAFEASPAAAQVKLTYLQSFDCGYSGSRLERVRDCNEFKDHEGKDFSLSGEELMAGDLLEREAWALIYREGVALGGPENNSWWLDLQTGQIWSPYMYYHSDYQSRVPKPCTRQSFGRKGSVASHLWEVPWTGDYKAAEEHGIRNILKMTPPKNLKKRSHYWLAVREFWVGGRMDRWGLRQFDDRDGEISKWSGDGVIGVRCVLPADVEVK